MLPSRIGRSVLPLFLALGGCATRQPLDIDQPVTGFDRKLSTHAYIEDGSIVTLIVGTRPARDKDGAPYVPFEIALANHGVRNLTLTRESFTLIDKDGKRYPAASPRELFESYEALDFDRRLAELEGIVFGKFGALQRYPSNFSPVPSDPEVVRDRMGLPKHGYILDFLYFPAPSTGVRDQPFELFLDTPELEDPVFVKFEVR